MRKANAPAPVHRPCTKNLFETSCHARYIAIFAELKKTLRIWQSIEFGRTVLLLLGLAGHGTNIHIDWTQVGRWPLGSRCMSGLDCC